MLKTKKIPSLWLLFCLGGFPNLSETIYSPALPDIAKLLKTDNHLVQWTLSIYFAGFALGVFLWGRISDRTGRKPAMLGGIIVYVIGSIFCMMSGNIYQLLGARLLQGFGASCGSVITQAIAREMSHDKKRTMFFSAFGFVMAFSIALGPLIGGYLTQWFDWRSNFTLLAAMGIVLITFTIFLLPETNTDHTKKSKVSVVLWQMLKDKRILGSIWLVGVVNGIMFSYFAEGPFIFIGILHLTASQYGWLGSAVALAALLGTLSTLYLVKRISPEHIIAWGCTLALLFSLILLGVSYSGLITSGHPLRSVILILTPLIGLLYANFGYIIPMTLSTALLQYKSVLGTAGALFGLGYYVVIAAITWGMGMIHNGTIIPMPVYFAGLCTLSCAIYYWAIR